MKNIDYPAEEKFELDQGDDIYEDYDSVKLKQARWQRILGWAIILYAVSNLIIIYLAVFYLRPDITYKIDAIMSVLMNLVVFVFNVFLINVGIKKIIKNHKDNI